MTVRLCQIYDGQIMLIYLSIGWFLSADHNRVYKTPESYDRLTSLKNSQEETKDSKKIKKRNAYPLSITKAYNLTSLCLDSG